MSNSIVVAKAKDLASMFAINGSDQELVATLKATAFKSQVSDAQMAALLIVASQYKLNPFTKEIYAFPDKSNGIVPVVGVDGWSRIINDHPSFDGMDFEQDEDSCTCKIYRKDRAHPISVTEYMNECRRDTGPWKSHPKRMLRHKAMIQCARLAFGYTGIFDEDEASRITEKDVTAQAVVEKDLSQEIGRIRSTESMAELAIAWADIYKAHHHDKTSLSILTAEKDKQKEFLTMIASNVVEGEYEPAPAE